MATRYQKRMSVRKTSDIENLARQYQKNVTGLTMNYEQAFADYEKRREQLMAPYQAAVSRYRNVDMPAYEAAVEQYNQKRVAYDKTLQKIQTYLDNPDPEPVAGQKLTRSRSGDYWMIGGKQYRLTDVYNAGWFVEDDGKVYQRKEPPSELYTKLPGQSFQEGRNAASSYITYGGKKLTVPEWENRGYVFMNNSIYEKKDVPAFTEKPPAAPQAPSAPQIEEFDSSKFQQNRAQLSQEFKREIGERKGARISAVGRRAARPLMQDK